jgi:hypothetical protein
LAARLSIDLRPCFRQPALAQRQPQEYMIQVTIRDAATGTVIAEAKSGLRVGADYSWDRGAVRLVDDRLLGR